VHPDPAEWGFDATIRSLPGSQPLPATRERALARRARDQLGISYTGRLSRIWRTLNSAAAGPTRVDYTRYMSEFAARERPPWVEFPVVLPRWDNTPRTARRGVVFTGSTPAAYERFLRGELAATAQRHGADSLVFVNAWNEWAEGAFLEPDEQWGRGFLEAHARAVSAATEDTTPRRP
jgi:hypothetical protein